MADARRIIVTADSQLLGGGSAYPVSIRDLGGGRGMLVLSDGREVGPITALTGPTGPPTTLAVGTVTKGDQPSVTITGTAPHQVIDLVLPKGDRGETGATGAASTVPGPANSLVIGTVTGGATAGASITGTAPAQTLSLVLPKGDPGPQGDKGDPGTVDNVTWGMVQEKPTEYPPAAHKHPVSDVTGLQTVLDAKVGTSDARLSDARTPKAHTHTQDDVNGLTDTLATKADKTALPTNTAWTATGFTFASGWSIHAANAGFWEPFVWRTRWGYVQLNGLVDRTGSNAAAGTVVGTLPASARPTRSFISGNLRFNADGTVTCNEAVVAGAYIALYGEAPIG